MIHWLVDTTASHPDLARGNCPDGLLNAAEARHLWALRTPRRQRDWLLGRWTAKRLLQNIIQQECGDYLSFDRLTIFNAPNGAPIVSGACMKRVTLSISHRDEYAFCAAHVHDLVHLAERCALGADIERIEPRIPTFVDDYFTEGERDLVWRAREATRDLLITAIWSAKEAALKAAHVGLTVDTRAVTCRIEPVKQSPETWTPFEISWDAQRIQCEALALRGWWRAMGEYVLTLAALETEAELQPNTFSSASLFTVSPPVVSMARS